MSEIRKDYETLLKSRKSLGKIETAMKRRVTVEKKKSSYLQKANEKDMLKSILFSFYLHFLFISNLRRKWSGKLATFPSDVGAWKGEVSFSKSDHSKNYPGSQLFFDI